MYLGNSQYVEVGWDVFGEFTVRGSRVGCIWGNLHTLNWLKTILSSCKKGYLILREL